MKLLYVLPPVSLGDFTRNKNFQESPSQPRVLLISDASLLFEWLSERR
jgi:hypothetical protein